VSDEKRNGNRSLGLLATLASLVVAVLAIGSYVVAIAGDNADTKRRVTNIENRQAEDRAETKRDVREVKADVKQIGTDVQIILRKLDAMEAAQRARERERR
jgi:hypothetical protein